MTNPIKTINLFALLVSLSLVPLVAQDAITLESASGEVGQSIDMPLYIRDISGTLLDRDNTIGTVVHQMVMRLTFDTSLVDALQLVPSGITSVHPAQLFTTTGSGFTTIAISYSDPNFPMPLTLDAAFPGDLVGMLRVTPSAAAAGQTISFTNVGGGGNNHLGDFGGTFLETVEDGNLTISLGTLTVAGSGSGTPSVQNFTATPALINTGESSRLAWNVTDADSVSIAPNVGNVASSGFIDVSPTQSTVYTLTATNGNGSVQRSVTVNVQNNNTEPPVIDFFNANPTTIIAGNSSTLSWRVQNATTVTINNGIGTVQNEGSRSVSPDVNTTYRIEATNQAGTVASEVTVTLTTERIPIISDFTVSPTQIVQGESATLSWKIEGADTVDIDQGIGRVSAEDSVTVSPDEDTVYTVLAQNESGSATATATLTVAAAPTISSFTANPSTINSGDAVQLSWTSTGGRSAVIEPGTLTVNPSGSVTLRPRETTTYTLTVTGDGGSSDAETTVTVEGPARLALNTESVPFDDQAVTLQIRLSASNNQAFSWRVANKPDWLTTNPESGQVTAGQETTVRLVVDRRYLFPGQAATSQLSFSADDLETVTVPVSMARPVSKSGESSLYFPLLEGGSEKVSQIGVTNLESSPVELDILIFDQEGALLQGPLSSSLAGQAGTQVAFSSDDVAWAVATVTSDSLSEPVATGVANIRTLDGEELYTLSPVPAAEAFLYVPHIAKDINQFYTLGAAVNLSDSTQALKLGAAETSGFDLGSPVSGGQRFFNFAQEMGGTVQGPGWGDIRLDGSGTDRLIGAEVFGLVADTGVRQSVGVGLNQKSAQEMYFVHIAGDTSRFWTGIVLINIGDSVTNVTVESYSAEGDLVERQTLPQFSAGEKRTFLVSAGRFDFGEGAAWLRVSADQPMTGYELFGTLPPGDQFAGFETITTLSNRLVIPHTENGVSAGGWTGVALVNPTAQTAEVQLRLVGADGGVKETNTATLNANVKLVQLASSLFDSDIAAGDVILIESSQTIAGFVLYGSGSQTMGALVAWPY